MSSPCRAKRPTHTIEGRRPIESDKQEEKNNIKVVKQEEIPNKVAFATLSNVMVEATMAMSTEEAKMLFEIKILSSTP